MTTKKKTSIYWALMFGAIALALGMLFANKSQSRAIDVNKFHGTFLSSPRNVAEFSLTGVDGKPFNNAALKGKWTMMFFGFTSCKTICPVTMADLGSMYRMLQKDNIKPLPQVVMVSLDPERDSQQGLNAYVKAFDPNFYGARGEKEAVKGFAKEMGIAYEKVVLKGQEQHYDIQHSGTIMLFNPEGKLTAFFTTHNPKELVEDYRQLVG